MVPPGTEVQSQENDVVLARKQKPVYLPSHKRIGIDIDHIMSGHTPGGGRGDGGKDNFPPGMTEAAILKAIKEAYKHAEKIAELQYTWKDGVEQVKQFFQGPWGDRIIQFWYNYTTKLNHHRLEAGGFDWRLEAA